MKSVKQRMLEGLPKWVRDKVSACNTGDAGHGDKIPGGPQSMSESQGKV